jgi:hypothetical protein
LHPLHIERKKSDRSEHGEATQDKWRHQDHARSLARPLTRSSGPTKPAAWQASSR